MPSILFALFALGVVALGYYIAVLWGVMLFTSSGQPTLRDVLLWSGDIKTSISQVQKSYDWTIAQWSGTATAALTAIFAFVTPVMVETFKGSMTVTTPLVATASLGVLFLLSIWGFCHYEMAMLNKEFVAVYGIVAEIK